MERSARRLLAGAPSAGLLSLLMLWSAVGSSAVVATAAPATAPVRVGVVLDLTSETGRKSLTCVSLALDDFYLKHPGYATRVELRVMDSRGELVAAVYAAEELMADKNAQVQAIFSPQPSPEAELFASIARRGNIPILSSSTTSPASSSSQARFFVRAAASTSSQAAAIAAILEAFSWRAAVLLHEDSPYSAGILSALVHAFQGRGHRARGVMDSVAVPPDETDGGIDAALLAVKDMPARVYVVHVPPALAARLFRRAVAAGMMSEGYVWIATAGVGDAAADGLGTADIDCMQGLVSLRPHVHATDQVRSFSRRFKARFRRQNPAPEDDAVHDDGPSVPVSLLWLYDTAWAAAAAAEASFRTAQRTAFLDALLNTTFRGLVGRFSLVDGQLQIPAYEIVNFIGNGARKVGFWTPEFGISRDLYPKISGKELKQILWPGETAAAPVGWSESPSGQPLRVVVPVKRGFSQFVEISRDPSTDQRVTGYCIDVFHAVMTKLNHPVDYQYVPVNDSYTESYDALVNLVHDKKADAVAGDVTITASRMELVSFTMPFADSGWSMIVAEEDSSNSMWIFVKPLTPELWFTSLAFFFFTGFVVWVIEHRTNPRFRGTPWKQFGVLFYFAFSTLVFSHKEKLESNLSKLVVIMWVFAVLILTTSYTANLTSMLTVRQLQPTISNLRESDYVGFQEGSFIADFLKEMGFSKARLRAYSTMDEYADALRRGSENGGVSAIFDEVPYLRLFLSRYCEGYAMAGPTYKSGGFGFVFPMGSPLVLDVSRAILELAAEEKLARIEGKWFGHPGACVSESSGGGGGGGDARLGLTRFGGLFLTNAVVSCLMLLIHLARFVYQERARRELIVRAAGEEAEAAGALPWLRAWLRRFDTLEDQDRRRRGESGAAEQGGVVRVSAPVDTITDDAAVYGRNAAAALVSEEMLAPLGGRSIGQPIGPGTCSLGVHVNAAAA